MSEYFSETAKVRSYLDKYCVGKGIDIACGLEKIVPQAIGIDFKTQYDIDDHPETVADFTGGWEKFLETQEPESFDYIYSSHLLEDYDTPFEVITKWLLYLKEGGFLVIVLPIEERFKEYCQNTGQIYNHHHKQNWTGAQNFCSFIPKNLRGKLELMSHSSEFEPVIDYNFFVVFRKVGAGFKPAPTLTVSVAIHNPDLIIFEKMLLSLKKYTPELSQLIIADNGSEEKDFVGVIDKVFNIQLGDSPESTPSPIESGQAAVIPGQSPGIAPLPMGQSPSIEIVHHPENLGFGKAHNENIKHATGKYFAVLNDDIEFFENWSTDMIEVLEQKPSPVPQGDSPESTPFLGIPRTAVILGQSPLPVAQVGMRTDVCNMLTKDGKGYYENTDNPDYNEGSCFMMPAEIARSFGPFDEDYEFAYFEDTDLSLRLKKAGYRIHAIKKNWRHYRAKTSGKIKIDIRGYHAKNEFLFRKRWGAYLLSKRFGRTIIIKREGSIGDVFLVTPVARALKEREPDSVILLMTRTPQAVSDNEDIDYILQMHIPFPCDEFIDLDYAYEKDFRKHIVDVYAEVAGVKVRQRRGILPLNGNNPFDSVIPEKFGRFVILEVSNTWTGKQWAKENYRELSKKIREDGTKVVVFGLTDEVSYIPYDLTFLNVLDIGKTINLIRKADMFIGHEGLCSHIAQSANIPSVVLFGCTLPEYTSDTSLENFRAVQTEALCRGCRHRFMAGTTIICPRNHECMKMISVDRVFEAYKSLLSVIPNEALNQAESSTSSFRAESRNPIT